MTITLLLLQYYREIPIFMNWPFKMIMVIIDFEAIFNIITQFMTIINFANL